MNRKAVIFSISLVLITFGSLIALFMVINNLEKQIAPVNGIGGVALEIAGGNLEAQRVLFYVDESAKISAGQAFVNLSKNAGLASKNDCGVIFDGGNEFVVWKSEGKSCFDVDFYGVFQKFFNERMNVFLNLLKPVSDVGFVFDNYDLFVDDGRQLFGVAVRPVLLRLISPEESRAGFWEVIVGGLFGSGAIPSNVAGVFAVRPSFTVPFSNDFSSLNKLKGFSRAVLDDVDGCNNKPDNEVLDCVNGFVQRHNINLNSEVKRVNNNLFLFDVGDDDFPVRFALFLAVAVVEPAPVVEPQVIVQV